MYRCTIATLLAACSISRADDTYLLTAEGSDLVYRVVIPTSGTPSQLPPLSNGSLQRIFSVATRAGGDVMVNSRGPCTACSGGGVTDLYPAACGTMSGSWGADNVGQRNPHGVCVVGDSAYLVDSYNAQIVRYQLGAEEPPVEVGRYLMQQAPWGGRGIIAAPELGELLVADCCNVNGIHRFTLHEDGSVSFRGLITGNSLNGPHNMCWTPWGELLVGSFAFNGVVSRFRFDSAGNAIANGVISGNSINGPGTPIMSSDGELLVFNAGSPTVSRFTFGPNHEAVAHGVTTIPVTAFNGARVGQMPAMVAVMGASSVCLGGEARMTVVGGSENLEYHWLHDGVPISTDENASAGTATLFVSPLTAAEAGSYRCEVVGGCGSATSNELTIAFCPGDYNCDGGVDGSDVDAFFNDWEGGSFNADINADGGIDGADVDAFFGRWEAGC